MMMISVALPPRPALPPLAWTEAPPLPPWPPLPLPLSCGTTTATAVLVEFPLVVDPLRLKLQLAPFIRNYRWEPERGLIFHVIEKDTGRLACTVSTGAAFAGAYDFSKAPDFAVLMEGFLDGLPEGGLVMCHPGFVDETLVGLDPLTTQREAEHAFLASDRFPALLAANNVTLA